MSARQDADNRRQLEVFQMAQGEVKQLTTSLVKFKRKSIQFDQLMQNTIVFETVFEEYLNKQGKSFTINKSNPHESVQRLIQEQYFEYAFLMRLVDTVMPSVSLLDEVRSRKAFEIGAESEKHFSDPKSQSKYIDEQRRAMHKANQMYKDSRSSLRNSLLGGQSRSKAANMSVQIQDKRYHQSGLVQKGARSSVFEGSSMIDTTGGRQSMNQSLDNPDSINHLSNRSCIEETAARSSILSLKRPVEGEAVNDMLAVIEEDREEDSNNIITTEAMPTQAEEEKLQDQDQDQVAREKEILELFPDINDLDAAVFGAKDIQRTDKYGQICQMVNQFPGYALRIVRRIIREKKDAIAQKLPASFIGNFDSLLSNMSRYLFEPPHSEETNYFSTTFRSDEKSFLLFLALFIGNADISTDPQTLGQKDLQSLDDPSTDYCLNEAEMTETLNTIFEGQTRKFTSLNYLTQLCTPALKEGKTSLNDTLEKLSITIGTGPTIPQIADKLFPLSNDLQEISSPLDKQANTQERGRQVMDLNEKVKFLLPTKLLDQVPEGGDSLTSVCLHMVEGVYECLRNRLFMMPVTIRIMLKFSLGLRRHYAGPKDVSDIFTNPHEIKEGIEIGATQKQEARCLADLLVGVWLNNLFRYPSLMLSNMKKQVNPAALWIARLIFEHLMCLETVSLTAYESLGNAGLDLTQINTFLTSKHSSVITFYNQLIKIETTELNKGRLKEQEQLLRIHLEFLKLDAICEQEIASYKINRDKRINENKAAKRNEFYGIANADQSDNFTNGFRQNKVKNKAAYVKDLLDKNRTRKEENKSGTREEILNHEVDKIFEMDHSQQIQLKKLRWLSMIGATDFFTLCYCANKEFSHRFKDTHAVGKVDSQILRSSCMSFPSAPIKKYLLARQGDRVSNNKFILGLNRIANYAELTEDIKGRLGEAKKKVAEKWIESYKEKIIMFKRAVPDNSKTPQLKKVMMRIYEVFKNYIRLFDIEKLLDRYKVEAGGSKNMLEIGFLVDELKMGLQLQYGLDKQAEMMVVFTQLESDLIDLDLVSPKKEYASDEEKTLYIKAQKSLIEEFSKFLKLEIDFVDNSQINIQAIGKSIQKEMQNMQSSVLQVRSFLSRKAPFMLSDYQAQRKEDYAEIRRKIRIQGELLLCGSLGDKKEQTEEFQIGEYVLEDLLVYLYQVLNKAPPAKYAEDIHNSWSMFDQDIDKIGILLHEVQVKMPDSEDFMDTVQLQTEEDLLNSLGRLNANWKDKDLYEAQIEKLMQCFGPEQGDNWSGQDTENLIREVVECSMTLMEMSQIDEESPTEYISDEVKQKAVTFYLFGCMLLRAAMYEKEDAANNSVEHKAMHLSSLRVIKQLLITTRFSFGQYDKSYSYDALSMLICFRSKSELPEKIYYKLV